jgi:signal transduction histidine kinase
LHDEIGQELSVLAFALQRNPQVEPNGLSSPDIHKQVGEILERVRRMSLDLRPTILDDFGVLDALLWLFGRVTTQTGIRVKFERLGLEDKRFGEEVETAVYRIVQEALTNAVRHARTKEITVRVLVHGDELNLEIIDGGIGFDPVKEMNSHSSSVLSGMRERARLVGGDLVFESARGKGARLTARFPLTNKPVNLLKLI